MATNISSTIDRIIDASSGDTNTAANKPPQKVFLPSSSWKGLRAGYYFGTNDQGTGYYLDEQHGSSSRKRSRSFVEEGTDKPPSKKSVRFGQDEVKLIPPKNAPTPLTGEELLEQAEQSLANYQGYTRKTINASSLNLKSYKMGFSKTIAKNQALRLEHADSPELYMESELSLQEDIQALQDLATSVDKYNEFVSVGIIDLLVGLFLHENTDIALVVITTLMELLDPELLTNAAGENLELIGWNLGRLTRALLDQSVGGTGNCGLELIVANLGRLQEDAENADDEEKKGVEDILTLIENLLEMDRMGVVKLACQKQKSRTDRGEDEEEYKYVSVTSILCQSTTCVSYLLEKMSQKNLEGWDTALRLHAAEILATIVQHDDARLHLDNLSQLKPYNSILVEDEEEASVTEIRNRKPALDPQKSMVLNASFKPFPCIGKKILIQKKNVNTLKTCLMPYQHLCSMSKTSIPF
jgi:hypothetical protein